MTTPTDGAATAADEATAQQIADQIEGQGEQVQQAEQQEPAPPAPLTRDDLTQIVRDEVGRLQGRIAQREGETVKRLSSELSSLIDERLSPLKQQAEAQRHTDAMSGMDAEQQRNYLWQELQKARQPTARTAEPAPQQVQVALSEDEKASLAEDVEDLLSEYGVQATVGDEWVWTGATKRPETMSYGDFHRLARKNIRAMAQARNGAKPAETPAPRTPAPSTGGAPRRSAARINSQTELADLVIAGKMNSEQARAAKQAIQEKGYYQL
jgi:hypothetical protein